jgi:hypothetical protein
MEVARSLRFMTGHNAASVTGVVPTGGHLHHWRLGFKQSSLGRIVRASDTPSWTPPDDRRFPDMLLSPRAFASR